MDRFRGVGDTVAHRLKDYFGTHPPAEEVAIAVFSLLVGLAFVFLVLRVVYVVIRSLAAFISDVFANWSIPSISVVATGAEAEDQLPDGTAHYDPSKPFDKDVVPCYDPATMQLLGHVPAMSAHEVNAIVAKAKLAAKEWRKSSFAQRRLLLRILLKFIMENMDNICRVSARDSGKPLMDCILGEIVTTCEKIHWLLREGEQHLKPEQRSVGILSFYKKACVEFHPLGVIAAIVPWNYPFHNVLNPLTASIFAGNALVIKVSEHASWSTGYYGRMISAALHAAGAPANLVQFVTGFGDAGNALVTSGVGKVIFVGSTSIGKRVMAAAAATVTPVVLELGGKDVFIVCDDADLQPLTQVALKAAYLNGGQNCAGGERFLVHERVAARFAASVVSTVNKMVQGPPLGGSPVDAGAMCMAGAPEKVQELVDDAVAKGAQVLAGGTLPAAGGTGQFYPPTVLMGVVRGMKIWEEEVFGPVLSITTWTTDDEVVRLANDCPFGLGSNVFSGSQARARRIASRLEAGMSSVNDFATTYMCQSLPFGGVKESGFDRFGGVEGLRGLCVCKSVAEDRVPWLMRSTIPPPWSHPVTHIAYPFGKALVTMFYGPGLGYQVRGLLHLAQCFLLPGSLKPAGRAAGAAKKQS